MTKDYKVKTYSMYGLKDKDILNIQYIIMKLGFDNNDFRIFNFSDSGSELKIMNEELHWMIKSVTKLQRIKKEKR